jgi:hypothetical protein
MVEVSLDLILASMDVLDQVSKSGAVFHCGNLLAINGILVHSGSMSFSCRCERLQVVGTVKLAMVQILVLTYGAGSLLLLEDAVIHGVRNFLVNTHAVPHLLLVNAVAEEAEAAALSTVQIFCGFVILTQSCGKLLKSLVLVVLIARISWGLANDWLKTVKACSGAILLSHHTIVLLQVSSISISSTIV